MEQERIDKFVAQCQSEFVLASDPHVVDRFRGLLYELLNPDAPTAEQMVNVTGFEDALQKSSGIDGDAGDWTTAGRDAEGYPVPKGSTEDVTLPSSVTGERPAQSQEELDAIAAENEAANG